MNLLQRTLLNKRMYLPSLDLFLDVSFLVYYRVALIGGATPFEHVHRKGDGRHYSGISLRNSGQGEGCAGNGEL